MSFLILIALIALIIAHFSAFSSYYINIFLAIIITYIIQKLLRLICAREVVDIIGVTGYSIATLYVIRLIGLIIEKIGIR